MSRWIRNLALALLPVLLQPAAAAAPGADSEAVSRWKAWRADLDHLHEEIEKPASLKQIFKVKGIDWKKVRKESEKRFNALAKAAKKRKKDDPRADELEFYGVLNYVVGQLRDGHASLQVDDEIAKAWWARQPKQNQVGVELMPGTHGTVVVAYANPGDPIAGRGITHEATILESVDGKDAAEYFLDQGEELLANQGYLSTIGRAEMLAMHRLVLEEDESVELVFLVLESNEKARRKYLELPAKKRAKALKGLKWKKKKVKLRGRECERARNPWTFRCQNAARPELTKTSDEDVMVGRLESGFGYVLYSGVSSAANKALAEACAALADCPGLVLDMRRNGGGGDGGAEEVFDKQEGAWDKPVAVLIGPWCMSAGETEVWGLQRGMRNKRCTIRTFGRTTAGASGDKIRWELPSGFAKGRFVFKHWHNEQSKIEGTGIVPDVVVDQDVVELSLGIDSHIRAAEDWLREECGIK
jgi:C-terminal processing protease CtpA/Prc